MERLVYSPRVYAYIKCDSGIIDVTDFIVSGTVTRRVSAISSAQLTLRNPNFRFTKIEMCDDADCKTKSIYPVFHPMDTITIILQRLANFPVQVFTGYLDQTPYLQLYPGTITLNASCTLKRLAQTYFNPALNATIELMQSTGWQLNQNSGMYFNPLPGQNQIFTGLPPSGVTGNPTSGTNTTKSNQQVQSISQSATDGGFAKLMEVMITQIGNWNKDNVHIMHLPSGLVTLVAKIFSKVEQEASVQAKEFREFIAAIIGQGNTIGVGSGSPGTSTTSAGPTPGGASQANVTTVCQIANSYGIPAAFVLAVIDGECNFDPTVCSHAPGCAECGCCGWFQWSSKQPYAGQSYSSCSDAQDLTLSTKAFCIRASQLKSQYGNDWYMWANVIQGCGQSGGTYNCYNNWSQNLALGNQLAQQYCSTAPGGAPSGSGTTGNPLSKATQSANPGPTASPVTGYVNAFQRIPGATAGRIDQGVDYCVSGQVCAIGNGTVVASSAGPGPNPANGWPGGGGIIYRLSDGPNAGQDIYIFENVVPLVHTGDTLTAGQPVVTASSSYPCLETGWYDTAGGHPANNTVASGQPCAGQTYNVSNCDGNETLGGQAFARFLASIPGTPAPNAGTGSSSGVTGSGTSGSGSTTAASPLLIAKAVAFATLIQGPTLEEQAEANLLTGRKGLMMDQPLLPFIQQLSQACLREFMSLPNGDFIAFYPDYFGGLSRPPYWEIYNIEIMDGGLQLSDDALTTHLYVIGDLIPFQDGNSYATLINEVSTTGVVTITDAFSADFINGTYDKTTKTSIGRGGKLKGKNFPDPSQVQNGYNFLNKYGPRPKKMETPFIRAPFYETFYAYQQFCLLWAEQFKSAFRFTFMPELYPGGLVALPEHGLQFYVSEVMHSFDYQNGFETNALLMAPAVLTDANGNPVNDQMVGISQGLIRAGSFGPSSPASEIH